MASDLKGFGESIDLRTQLQCNELSQLVLDGRNALRCSVCAPANLGTPLNQYVVRLAVKLDQEVKFSENKANCPIIQQLRPSDCFECPKKSSQ